jgi:2,5-furandicarboxylate decarboxylase 1
MSNSGVLDTRFRSALERMAVQGRLLAYAAPIDPHLEVAAVMKKLDGGPALLFSAVDGYDMPVIGNLLSCQANCEAAFGIDFNGIREFVGRALGSPQPPVLVEKAPAQEHIHTDDIDLARMLPALHHTAADAGRYVTAGARSRHRHLQRVLSPPPDRRQRPRRHQARLRPSLAPGVRARKTQG